MAHPNEKLVRDGFAAFAAGDMDTLRRLIAPDAIWHFPGHNPLAGSYKGVDEILTFFGRIAQETGGTFANDLHDVVGNDEHVFAATTATAERGGKSLRDSGILLFHVHGGRVTEAWSTNGDQYLVDAFWS